VDAVAATDTGRRRDQNEDAYLLDLERRLLVVADGLGGHAAGEIASQVAVETISERLTTERLANEPAAAIAGALQAAHRQVLEAMRQDSARAGMGTTLVVAYVDEDRHVTVGHVGDSRAYIQNGAGFQQITADHVLSGLFGRSLTQAIGVSGTIDPDIVELDAGEGDVMLLCTDGLTDMVADDDIRSTLSSADLDGARDGLVSMALERGGHDNVTLVLARL
jgi:PPM family protein phosphatase